MFRGEKPLVVGCRSVHHGIRPGFDDPQRITEKPDNLLDWLVFEVLKCDPATAHVRDIHATTGGELTAEERGQSPEDAKRDEIKAHAAAHGIDTRLIAARFAAEQKADIRTADLDQLTAFLSELQQDAAHKQQTTGAAA
jgi:hypothetical protein